MTKVSLDDINSALGITLTAELITSTLNVACCDASGLWDDADFQAIKHRLVNHLLYRTPQSAKAPSFDFFTASFFD